MNLRPRSGWHDLCHHHASLLIAAGLSPRAVADRLGHKDAAETLTVYAHLWVDDEDRAVEATPDVRRATARDAAAQVNGLTVARRPASGLQASSSTIPDARPRFLAVLPDQPDDHGFLAHRRMASQGW
jgi:hypothetical protein